MFGRENPISLIRRPIGRFGEFIIYGQVAQAFGLVDNFDKIVFGHGGFYVLIFFVGSVLFDLVEIAVRPDLLPPS